jgi:hypothetical protein
MQGVGDVGNVAGCSGEPEVIVILDAMRCACPCAAKLTNKQWQSFRSET